MVNVSTGDFVYNIPLMDIEGYPINISYHSGITMDQEASWVGLGWNLNPGVINRTVRGIPDDFNGDKVIHRFNMRKNITYGATFGFGLEVFGFKNLGINYSNGARYNNYNGYSAENSVSLSLSSGEGGKGSLSCSEPSLFSRR